MNSARICAFVLVALLFAACPAQLHPQGQAKPKNPREEKPWQQAVVPAEVVKFGADLEGAASAHLKDWCSNYVRKELRDKPIEPKAVIGAVDRHYAAASDLARDAGIYLVYYLAYRDDEENQRMLSFRIRDIDRETYDITRELAMIHESELNRLASRNSSLTPAERIRRDEQEQKANSRLRELGDERQIKGTRMDFSRKKVNIYLKLMSYAYDRMKGTPPAVLDELK